jgi:hypothetical protein
LNQRSRTRAPARYGLTRTLRYHLLDGTLSYDLLDETFTT